MRKVKTVKKTKVSAKSPMKMSKSEMDKMNKKMKGSKSC